MTAQAPEPPSRSTVQHRPPVRGFVRRGSARAAGLAALGALVVAVSLLSLVVGARSISPRIAIDALTHYDKTSYDEAIVQSLRLPRMAVGLLVGGALGLAGALMQGVMRNPLADPGILGINSGATLAIVLGIYAFGVDAVRGYVWLGFAGAATAAVVVYLIGALGRDGATPVKLTLAGAATAALLGSATTTILLLDSAALEVFRFWAVGSLATSSHDLVHAIWPFVAAGAVLALGLGRMLNTLALGEDVARALGQRVGLARALCALAIVVLCGASVAVAGPIAFVGLTAPHVARAITGPDYRWVLPYSALLGAILLLAADVVGRVLAAPGELPAGVVTAFVGAPVLIVCVRYRKLAEP